MGRKIDFSTSMNSGSRDTGRWEQQRGSSAQQIMCPAGGCPGVPPSTGHLAPGTRILAPRSRCSRAQTVQGHGLAWAAPTLQVGDSRLERREEEDEGSRAALRPGSCQGCQRRCCRIALAWLGTAAELPVSHSSAPLGPASLPSPPNRLEY